MTHNLPPTLAISALMPKVPRKAIAWLVYALAEIDAKTALRSESSARWCRRQSSTQHLTRRSTP